MSLGLPMWPPVANVGGKAISMGLVCLVTCFDPNELGGGSASAIARPLRGCG